MSATIRAGIHAVRETDFIVGEGGDIAILIALVHIIGRVLSRRLIPRLPPMTGINAACEILIAKGVSCAILAAHRIENRRFTRIANYPKAKIIWKACRYAGWVRRSRPWSTSAWIRSSGAGTRGSSRPSLCCRGG